MKAWFENDQPVIAGHTYPAALIELGTSRGVDPARLRAGTRIEPGEAVSAEQLLRLYGNAARMIAGADLGFVYGSRLLPGNESPLAMSLLSAGSLREALATLAHARALASPLLSPRLRTVPGGLVLHWDDAVGLGRQQVFVVEAMCAAVASLAHWLGGRRIDWAYCFRHPQPAYIEQYEVQLGGHWRFDAAFDAMFVADADLDRPWPRASPTRKAEADRLLAVVLEGVPTQGLRARVSDYLRDRVRDPPRLDAAAAHFHASPATFKRKLAKHGCSYQQLLDDVSREVCTQLIGERGMSNEEAAAYLNYSDLANFRRSFKRWTGLTPGRFRAFAGLTGAVDS